MLHELSIAEAGRRLRAGSLSAVDLAEYSLARIETHDPELNSMLLVLENTAREQAQAADADFVKGIDRGPLQGIPFGLKDIFDCAGIATSCHSRLMQDHVAHRDAETLVRLRAMGAVLLGKMATHEFAVGGPSFDLPFPPARNPWNRQHITGGSSSGSGAAVAAGLMRFALGSDSGGSLRVPAAYCGVVGLKPSFGLVSRHGVFPLSPTLDHCGPLARTVEDAAIVLQAIAGFDPKDCGSIDMPVPSYTEQLHDGVHALRLAWPRKFIAEAHGLSSEVLDRLEDVLSALANAGAVIEEIDLPDEAIFNAAGHVILCAEGFSIHEHDLRSRPEAYGRATTLRLTQGALLTASDYLRAREVQSSLSRKMQSILGRFDAMITAVTLSDAPQFDAMPKGYPFSYRLQTMPFNLTGMPALAMPTGLSKAGLPLALQIVGSRLSEATLLRVAAAIEKAFPPPFPPQWHEGKEKMVVA